MLKIGINGLSGRMGQEIAAIIAANPTKYQLVETDYEVMVDFSAPEACLEIARQCAAQGLPIVIGTTGFSAEQLDELVELSSASPFLLSPNMSLSVNVLFKVSRIVAQALGDFEVEIVESHHRHKKDAPSGTALKLGRMVAEARRQDFNQVAKFARLGVSSAGRAPDEIGFAVVRGGDVVGKHTVSFFGEGEELSLTSDINNRRSFAYGAVLAAEYLSHQTRCGLYGMDDVLGLTEL